MKLAVIAGACLVISLCFAACAEVTAPAGGEFEPVREGVLTVATDYLPQPGFWEGEDGPTGGFEWGLAQSLAEQFDLERIEVIEQPFAKLISGDLGGADIAMAQITPTTERNDVLDFSEPYLSANPAVLVAGELVIRDVMAARELTWAVETGTTLEETLDRRIVPQENVNHVASQPRVVEAVRQGHVDAALLDLPVALAYANDDPALRVAAQLSTDESLAVALPEGSPNREAISTAIRAMVNDGTISDLAERWLGTGMREGSFTVEDVHLLRTK